MKRRDFIKYLTVCPLATQVPVAFAKSENLTTQSIRKLILVELKGGNDGLNTVIPYNDNNYYRLRPNLAVERSSVIQLSESIGLNAALEELLPIWNNNELAIALGVGYPNPNLSHFRSIEIWNTASRSDEVLKSGWLTRAFNQQSSLQSLIANGVSFGYDAGPLAGTDSHTIIMKNPKSFIRQAKRITPQTLTTDNPALNHILNVQNEIQNAALALKSHLGKTKPITEPFPNSRIGKQLKLAALLVQSEVPLAVIKVSHGGFDTHSAQRQKHNRLLEQLADALRSLQVSLSNSDHWKDTVVMTYSEFGRRAAENGSRGTDHGTAAPQFILGGAIRGGLFGKQPSLDYLVNANLQHHLDYRSIYASIAQSLWGIDVKKVGLDYPLIDLIKI